MRDARGKWFVNFIIHKNVNLICREMMCPRILFSSTFKRKKPYSIDRGIC